MSISPTTSSVGFSFYSKVENEERQEEASSQPIPLKDRIYSIADRIGYRFYAGVINLPHIMPTEFAEAEYERIKKIVFADKPKPFAEIKQRVLSYAKLDGMSWEEKIREENIDLFGESDSWGGAIM